MTDKPVTTKSCDKIITTFETTKRDLELLAIELEFIIGCIILNEMHSVDILQMLKKKRQGYLNRIEHGEFDSE